MNGPALAARGPQVAVAWHTEAQDLPRVRLAISENSAASFGRPIDVHHGTPLGRVDLVSWGPGSDLLVSYLTTVGDQTGLFVRRVHEGKAGPPVRVAGLEGARGDGCPRMIRSRDRALIAWTSNTGSGCQVRCAWIEAR